LFKGAETIPDNTHNLAHFSADILRFFLHNPGVQSKVCSILFIVILLVIKVVSRTRLIGHLCH